MKKFMKNLKFKICFCIALIGAVLFSCVFGARVQNHSAQTSTVAAGKGFDISDTLDTISTVAGSYSLMDDFPLTPENQTSSNLCWAYSSSKALESALMKQAGEYYNFSEIAVPYIGYYYKYIEDTIDHSGNVQTFVHIAETYGLVFESDFSNDKYFDITLDNYMNYSYVTKYATTEIMDAVTPVYFMNDGDYYSADRLEKQWMLKKFIANYGGLFAGIGQGAIVDQSGIWKYTTNANYEGKKWIVGGNHAICLVGYDTNGFLALNSWGAANDVPYLFYIPYDYDFALTTAAGFVVDGELDVEMESSSAQKFEALTKYDRLNNVFCLGEEIEFTLSFDGSINFSSVYVDAYKGAQEVSNAFHFDYDDANRKVTISLTSGVLPFEGGAYTFRVYESDKSIGVKNILVLSGTEIAYFNMMIVSNNNIEDSEHFMNSYLTSDDSVTYYVRPTPTYVLTFYLTEMNKFNWDDLNKLSASVGEPRLVYANNGAEVEESASLVNVQLAIQDNNDTSNEYTLTIRNLSTYKGKIIRIPLRVNSNIAGISANRIYYINLVVSKNAATYTKTAYAVEYVLNGGVNAPENIDRIPVYANESSMTDFILKTPSKIGGTFIGWYLDKDFTTEVTKLSAELTTDIVLYAKWEKVAVDYFDMTASLVKITDHTGQNKALGSNIIYGDDLDFEVVFAPSEVLAGYNYIVRYYFYLNGTEFKTEQIDKVLLKSLIELNFAEAGTYNVRVVVAVVISHNMSVSEERYITFSIGKKTVSFGFSDLVYTYDGESHLPTVALTEGSVYAEDLTSFDWTLSNSAKINAGNYDFAVVEINNANYEITGNAACQLQIKRRAITIVWDTLAAYYNARPQIPSYTLSGILTGDSAEIEEVVYKNMVNAGKYTIVIDENSVTNDNYVIANVDNIEFEIKPAELVLTINDVKDRASTNPLYRLPATYTIQGTVYETVASLHIQIYSVVFETAEDKRVEEVGTYPITATYSNSNYNIRIIDGEYTLLGSYKVIYTLPNGETYIEYVTEGENPVGVPEVTFKAGFLKKLIYSQELANDNGKDLDIVVEEVWDVKTIAILGIAGVVVLVFLYLAVTRKARRNKVR